MPPNRDRSTAGLPLGEPLVSGELFRKAFRASPDAMVVYRLADQLILDVNDVWEEVTGFRRQEVVGRSQADLNIWDPADAARVAEQVQREGILRNFEFAFRKRGETQDRFALLSAEQIEIAGQACMIAVGREITERRRMEEELRVAREREARDRAQAEAARAESEAAQRRLQVIVEQMPAGVMIADPSGEVTFTNHQATAIFHGPVPATRSTRELETTFEAWDREGRRLRAEEFPLARGLAGESVLGEEVHFRRLDGSPGVVRANAAPIRGTNGETLGGITVYYDITQEKEFEQQLREENRINETLHKLGASFATELDEQKLLQLITDEATALTGAQFGSFFFNVVDGRGESYMLYTLSGVPREAFARFPMPRNTAIFSPTFAGQGVMRLDDVTKDPRYGKSAPHHGMPQGHLPVRSYLAIPVLTRKGEVLGGLFFGHSEPGRFREQQERILVGLVPQAAIALENARLYKTLRASEEKAQRAVEQASEADRRKDEFLAMLGHELRNPLAPIVTALQLMRTRSNEVAPHERSVIERQVGHLSRLVDDLLDVSRITRGKIELKRQPVELSEVVRKAVEIASPVLEERNHHLTLDVPGAGAAVDADPVRLAQVVANLLNNAAKYTEPRGRILLSVGRQGAEVLIRVRDNGIGIEPSLLPRLFQLFTQGKRALDRSQGGLGLGLTLVKSLVEMHGGSVSATSDGPGKGSEFTVRLPALEAPALARQPNAAPAPSAARRRSLQRILVVDDNPDAADTLAEALRLEGHEVRVALDGPGALAIAPGFRPHSALLDIGLPVMDGYELAGRLRNHPALAGIRLIAVSGYGQPTDRRRSLDAGFAEHLVKPVELEAILDALGGSGS
jgi:PAS domain S-box-containing protein